MSHFGSEKIHVELRLKYTHSKLSPETIHPHAVLGTMGSMQILPPPLFIPKKTGILKFRT